MPPGAPASPPPESVPSAYCGQRTLIDKRGEYSRCLLPSRQRTLPIRHPGGRQLTANVQLEFHPALTVTSQPPMVLGLIGKRELGPGGHKTLRNTFLSLRLGVT